MRKKRKDKGKSRDHYSAPLRKRIKSKKCITLDKGLWASIDLQAEGRYQSRSEFINEILKTILGSTKSFIKYELREKSQQLNYAKFQAANYNADKEIAKAIEEMKADR